MKKFIFWKLENGKKETVFEVASARTKEEVRADYRFIITFDGIDSVNC